MKILFLLPFFFALSTATPIETFKIDLSLPPELRWKEVIISKAEYIQNYTKMALSKLEFPKLSLAVSEFYGKTFFKNTDFAKEIEGVARYSNLSFAEMFLMNYMYESFASCTSIVYEGPNGEIVLGHNLDYYFTVPMAHAIVLLEFYRNGRFLYKAHSVAGQIGIFTALRPENYAITLNQRETGDYVNHYKQLLINKVYPVIYNIRMGLESFGTFDEAIRFFSSVQFGSPCYLTICGTKHNEGVVITRNPTNVSDITRINTDYGKDTWFLVQTNSDRDLENYEILDIRRFVGEERMRNISRKNINENNMVSEVLGLFPNNNELTILSNFVRPQTGDFNTTMWL